MRGRVLEDEGFTATGDADSRWRTSCASGSDWSPTRCPARASTRAAAPPRAVTDREGYFRLELATRAKAGWNPVELQLAENPRVRAQAGVLVPSLKARFGVISDIDDTIVASNVTNKLRMIFHRGAGQRAHAQTLSGVAAFYRAACESQSHFSMSPKARGTCTRRSSSTSKSRDCRSDRCF